MQPVFSLAQSLRGKSTLGHPLSVQIPFYTVFDKMLPIKQPDGSATGRERLIRTRLIRSST